jgi:S1-C subfamily serine protease
VSDDGSLQAATTPKERDVTYDREEWRRPWPAPVRPDSGPTVVPPSEPSATLGTGSTASSLAEPAPAGPEPAADGGPEPNDPGAADRTEEVEASAVAVPIERHPQPPPESWDEASAGPGSPAGSVRPPDTTGTVDAPQRPRRDRGLLAVALAALLGAVLGTVLTLAYLELRGDRELDEGIAPPTEEARDTPVEDGPASVPVTVEATSVVPAVAEAVTPSVVVVDIPVDEEEVALGRRASLGSGVIYRSDGYILTNEHVVRGSDQVRVRLADGELLDAEVIGRDELNDLAVVRVEASGLPAITFRDTEAEPIVVGETVIAIGSPFGLDASVTSGIVSALNREIDLPEDPEAGGRLVIPSLIQTDAAINPGNSGGALVDTEGRLIGINTAILSATGANQGVGFAVNVRQALVSADQLIEQGFVRHPLLGVGGVDVSPEVAERLGLDSARGAVIENVQEETGAADADLRPGDVIVGVDGTPIATMSQLVAEVRGRQPGDEVELAILRDGDELSVTVVLSERPRSDADG